MTNSLLITNAEIYSEPKSTRASLTDVRCANGLITEISDQLKPLINETVIDAKGGALLPGLHDHHIHLMSLAAAHASVRCGPPHVNNLHELTQALQNSETGNNWLRGIAYHDSVAGELNREKLDKIVNDRPVRIQHRSGKMWIVNSTAAELLELDRQDLPGKERDKNGVATGRLFRMDDWLREALDKQTGGQAYPELGDISRLLASYGVTGITDTTPGNSASTLTEFIQAAENNKLLQRVLIMGDHTLPISKHPLIQRGAVKLLLDEYQLPDFEEFKSAITESHQQQRPVAVHCVTQTESIFALTALTEAGSIPGDRIEHASVCPDDILPLMLNTGVTVVTQPGFIHERGDQYLKDVEPADQAYLYRLQSFLKHNIPLGGSSDAPYGSPDPWIAIKAAVTRSTSTGKLIGENEKLTPEQALALFTSHSNTPGGEQRKLAIGEVADLCLMKHHWQKTRICLNSADVRLTLRDGYIIYQQ